MEEPVSWAVSVHAQNTSLADIVSMMSRIGKKAKRMAEILQVITEDK